MGRLSSLFTSKKSRAKKETQRVAAQKRATAIASSEERKRRKRMAKREETDRMGTSPKNNSRDDAEAAVREGQFESINVHATDSRMYVQPHGGRRRTRHIKRKTHKRRRTIHNRR